MPQPTAESLDTVERELLRTLSAFGPTYPTVAARRTAVSPDAVDDHCDRLADLGLLERVTAEPVYRITEAGRGVLASADSVPRSVTSD